MANTPSLPSRLFSAMRRMIGAADRPAAGTSKGAGAAGPASADSLEGGLTKLLANKQTIAAGRIQIISLEKARHALGDRWPEVAETFHNFAESTIRKHLESTDIYIRHGELTYVLFFAKLSKKDAQFKCALIAGEIWRRMFGKEAGLDEVDVRTVVVDVDKSVALESFDAAAAVQKLLDAEQAASVRGADEAGTAARPAAPSGVERRKQRDPNWRPQAHDPRLSADDGAENVEGAAVASGSHIAFKPAFDVPKNVLSMYVCAATSSAAGGGPITDDMHSSGTIAAIADADCAVLRRAGEELAVVKKTEPRLFVASPVHVQTLGTIASRDAFMTLCNGIPAELRPHLVFELVGIEEGFPLSRVTELVAALRPYAISVFARIDLNRKNFDNLGYTGLQAVGVNALAMDRRSSEHSAAMKKFVLAAHQRNLRCFIHGIVSPEQTTAAVSAGFETLHSEAIAATVAEPEYACRPMWT